MFTTPSHLRRGCRSPTIEAVTAAESFASPGEDCAAAAQRDACGAAGAAPAAAEAARGSGGGAVAGTAGSAPAAADAAPFGMAAAAAAAGREGQEAQEGAAADGHEWEGGTGGGVVGSELGDLFEEPVDMQVPTCVAIVKSILLKFS